MHPFPCSDALAFLVGLEIGQICLDPWSTQFRFADGGQITMVSAFEYIDVGGRAHAHQADEAHREPVLFRELVQQRIVALEATSLVLTLTFESGSALRLRTDEGMYECGQIYPPDRPDNPIVF